jgi:hypothetical protein
MPLRERSRLPDPVGAELISACSIASLSGHGAMASRSSSGPSGFHDHHGVRSGGDLGRGLLRGDHVVHPQPEVLFVRCVEDDSPTPTTAVVALEFKTPVGSVASVQHHRGRLLMPRVTPHGRYRAAIIAGPNDQQPVLWDRRPGAPTSRQLRRDDRPQRSSVSVSRETRRVGQWASTGTRSYRPRFRRSRAGASVNDIERTRSSARRSHRRRP